MATKTANYGLNKPNYDETADIEQLNSNADIIDEALTPTADPTATATSNGPHKLVKWVSVFAGLIKAITGKAYWYQTPSKSLEDLNTHLADEMPHQLKDITTNKIYKYGIKQQDGHLIFAYQEVV